MKFQKIYFTKLIKQQSLSLKKKDQFGCPDVSTNPCMAKAFFGHTSPVGHRNALTFALL